MGYMIEIKEDAYEELSENVENVLRYGGKVMHCLDKMKRERMGERMPDYRDGGRDYADWEDNDRRIERRGGGYRGWSRY